MEKLIDMLEENDDVQNVYHTWEMPDDGEQKHSTECEIAFGTIFQVKFLT